MVGGEGNVGFAFESIFGNNIGSKTGSVEVTGSSSQILVCHSVVLKLNDELLIQWQ